MANSTKNILAGLVKNEPIGTKTVIKGDELMPNKAVVAGPTRSLADITEMCMANSTPRKGDFDLTPQS
ncbi:Uncharacterised protein [Legionella beliardensis]|uniref:Uncharacterized protein n=1 Tax=Legionella beliardensis TaxID=91822 RepID=A0A378I0A3_9GAMM|nr:hypothetical protein [Legionella beliardensis]STX28140.1 Uncharacterised protein [Legionella beliardensis]